MATIADLQNELNRFISLTGDIVQVTGTADQETLALLQSVATILTSELPTYDWSAIQVSDLNVDPVHLASIISAVSGGATLLHLAQGTEVIDIHETVPPSDTQPASLLWLWVAGGALALYLLFQSQKNR